MAENNKDKLNEAGGEPDPVSVPGSENNGTAAAATLHPNSKGSMSRTELLASVVTAAGGIETGDLNKFLESLSMNKGSNQAKGNNDESKNRASIVAHGPLATEEMKRAVKDDLKNIFAESNLSDETLTRTQNIFEAAVSGRMAVEIVRLEEENATKLNEAIEVAKVEINDKVDKYLTHTCNTWLEDNQVAIETSLRQEIYEDFMNELKVLLEKHNFSFPEGQEDVVEALSIELAEKDEKLNELIEKNIELTKSQNNSQKDKVVEELSINLSELQKDNFRNLSEGVEFDGIESTKKTLTDIRETLVLKKAVKPTGLITEGEAKPDAEHVDVIDVEIVGKTISPKMSPYTSALDNIKN
jgi:hypothetical protein